MKTVILTLTKTSTQPLPAGATFGGYVFTLTDNDPAAGFTPMKETTQGLTASFAGIAAGIFTATVAAVDQNGAPLLPPLNLQVVVPADAPAPPPPAPSFEAPEGFSYALA